MKRSTTKKKEDDPAGGRMCPFTGRGGNVPAPRLQLSDTTTYTSYDLMCQRRLSKAAQGDHLDNVKPNTGFHHRYRHPASHWTEREGVTATTTAATVQGHVETLEPQNICALCVTVLVRLNLPKKCSIQPCPRQPPETILIPGYWQNCLDTNILQVLGSTGRQNTWALESLPWKRNKSRDCVDGSSILAQIRCTWVRRSPALPSVGNSACCVRRRGPDELDRTA